MTENDCNDGQLAGWLNRFAEAPQAGVPGNAADTVERALIAHDAPQALIGGLRDMACDADEPQRLLSRLLRDSYDFSSVSRAMAARILLIGAPAAGKSSMTAKLAALDRTAPAIFSADTDRPGGMMRLTEYLSVLDIEPIALPSPMSQIAAIDAAPGRVIIDTAGIDRNDYGALAGLGQLAQAVSAEIVLVASALSDADEMGEWASAAIALGAKKVMFSRLDMARRLGTVLSVAETGLALCEASVTANFAYGLRPLTATALAERLLRGIG